MENVIFSEQSELMDEAKARLGLTSDYQLARALGWTQTMIRNYRQRRRCMAAGHALHFHEVTKIELRRLLVAVVADQRSKDQPTNGSADRIRNEKFLSSSLLR